MIPIDQLLSRIRWDEKFAQAEFEIGYYDRLQNDIIRVGLASVLDVGKDRFALHIQDSAGIIHSVPLHRVRQVYRNRELIWQRPEPPPIR
ncbi:MAG: DUF504 domain-containing protein [Desulfobulbaceae bacterium]|nr:DUF504 domain-containing protein [Desulfobulbaceae bacterium]